MGIGISLDGTKEVNDLYRVDKKGQGTFDSVVEKIKLCQKHNLKFGLLSVVNPIVNGKDSYRFFVDELNLDYFDFLLPDANYHAIPLMPVKDYGHFMVDVFNEWIKDNNKNPKIFVRFCVNAIELFLGNFSRLEGYGRRSPDVLPLICVSNNGDLGPLDELRNSIPEKFIEKNIMNTSFKEFIADSFFHQYLNDMNNSPNDCKHCAWEVVCGGGAYGHRYNKEFNSFGNKSIYCEAIQLFYANVLKHLLINGYALVDIKKFLHISD